MAEKKLVKAFSTPQRITHWLIVVAFSFLVLTGLTLYLPALSPLAQGEAGYIMRTWHRIGAIIAAVAALIYLIFDFKGLLTSMKKIFTWSADDLGWLKAAPAYYFSGDEKAMPPQDKFNAGQKLWYLNVVLGGLVMVATGLVMWFGKGSVSPGLFQWAVFLHDIIAILMVAFFLVHFYLAVMHPLMKGSLDGMRFGYLSEDYVKSHHAKWYQELKEKGQV